VARDIYDYYCKDGFRVLDPCAGFGGRLMGASVSKRRICYTGIEPSSKTYHGLVEEKRFIASVRPEFRSNIVHGCAEEELLNFKDDHFDFAFTSPPYFDTEEYDYDSTQSFVRYASYDAWLSGFLRPVLAEVYRIVKNEGFFVVNIGKYDNTPIAEDAIEMAEEIGFYLEETKFIAFPKYNFTKGDGDFRNEPVLVFKK
jgi:SAM-dependent methyltransferase